ncbi:hypothetical protein Ddc_12597 [Ditylenchus destructor]|nr:hypothetical protein Ddc_12597 [Ditylenchus destructor]
MLLNILHFLILCYNAIIVSGDCPDSREWRNVRISPGGPLVCARLYGDEKCSGFPLPFGINSSTPDLGTESSSAINFEGNNVTALVRPGCNMFLWEGANFTGRLDKSTNHTWHVDRRHYSSALCNCSVNDVDLLQCELRAKWEDMNFCDFRESNFGVYKDETGLNIVPNKWIFNEITETFFQFSSTPEKYSTAKDKCRKMGSQLANLGTDELKNWTKPLLAHNRRYFINGGSEEVAGCKTPPAIEKLEELLGFTDPKPNGTLAADHTNKNGYNRHVTYITTEPLIDRLIEMTPMDAKKFSDVDNLIAAGGELRKGDIIRIVTGSSEREEDDAQTVIRPIQTKQVKEDRQIQGASGEEKLMLNNLSIRLANEQILKKRRSKITDLFH